MSVFGLIIFYMNLLSVNAFQHFSQYSTGKLHCMGKKWECMPIGYGLPFPNIVYVKCRSTPISYKNVCVLLNTS